MKMEVGFLNRTNKRRHFLYMYEYIKSTEKMLKNVNYVLGLVAMNTYVKFSIVSIFNHGLTQLRYRHSQVRGRLRLLHLLNHNIHNIMTCIRINYHNIMSI